MDPLVKEFRAKLLYKLVLILSVSGSVLVVGFNLFKNKLLSELTLFASLPLMLFVYAIYVFSLLLSLLYFLFNRSFPWQRRWIALLVGLCAWLVTTTLL